MGVEELVRSIISGMADEEFSIITAKDEASMQIKLSKKDIARVIGRGGKTARAIRVLLGTYAKLQQKSIDLVIEEYDDVC